jgi:YggT family protein
LVVLPLRRFIPGFFGLDLSSLLPAWWCQILLAGFEIALFGGGGGDQPLVAALGLLTLGGLYLLKVALYTMMVLVLVSALLSWVSPHAPMTPLIGTLAEPFLSPFRRWIPLIAGVDLSPLVAVLVIQIGLILTDGLTRHFILMIWGPG